MVGGRDLAQAIFVPMYNDVQAMQFAVMDAFEGNDRSRNFVTERLDWSLRISVK